MSKAPPNLGALYLRHGDAMHKVAASVLHEVGRAAEAGDAVHDAIVSLMESPPRDVENWEAFLVTAAKRKAIDRVRSAAVRHAGPEFDVDLHDRPDDADFAEDVAETLDRQQQAAQVWDCLSILDERHRKAVWETKALGRPRSDVAEEMGVTPARISQMSTRALGLLLEEMKRREG